MTSTVPIIEVERCTVGYGRSMVIRHVDFVVNSGEIVLIVGRNASGKSTLMKGVFGQLPLSEGVARLRGVRAPAMSPHWWHRHGAAFVHQGARVFNDLSVNANRRLASAALCTRGSRKNKGGDSGLHGAQLHHPFRGGQLARTLSGGERQLLAISMAVQGAPDVVCLDEPSIGLSPSTRAWLYSWIGEAASRGVGFIIIEQKWREVVSLTSRALVIHNGTVAWSGSSAELEAVSTRRGFAL